MIGGPEPSGPTPPAQPFPPEPLPQPGSDKPGSDQPDLQEPDGRTQPSDSLRFAMGTLSRIPVQPPRIVNRRVAGTGLILAPVVGLVLGSASALPLLLGGSEQLDRLLSATLTVALCAWLTRGLHWDGLADLTDGLGSRRPAKTALAIMRAPEIGTFAALTLLFTVFTQVLALALLPNDGQALAGWVSAQVGARVALGLAAGSWIRPARSDGLGAAVIGSVTPRRAVALIGCGVILCTAACLLGGLPVGLGVASVAVAATVALAVGRISQTRLGGSTGDVLGATVELSVTAILLLLVLRP